MRMTQTALPRQLLVCSSQHMTDAANFTNCTAAALASTTHAHSTKQMLQQYVHRSKA
jgi:hypothetical protein